ncbi:MAG: FHA domain-containing protein [Acidimicrobiales bacterium]
MLVLGTNYSAVIRPLQWLVVALIFLFFLRVVRAVFVEVRPAGPTRAQRRAQRRVEEEDQRPLRDTRSRKQLRLEVIEPREREGTLYDLDGEVTVGRSNGCGIPTTYDSYSSTVHARIYRSGGQLWVEDLGSTNGTFVNSERIAQPSRLAKGDLLQIGATVFEVRR